MVIHLMDYRRFLAYELVAATLWNTAFCSLGYFLAGEIGRLQMLIERTGWLVVGLLLVLFLFWKFAGKPVKKQLMQKRRTERKERGVPRAEV